MYDVILLPNGFGVKSPETLKELSEGDIPVYLEISYNSLTNKSKFVRIT